MVNNMKRKKLNVKNMMGKDTTLSRSEMRKIMAGSGNMYCMVGGEQFHCFGVSLTACLDACLDNQYHTGQTCGGCAQFP